MRDFIWVTAITLLLIFLAGCTIPGTNIELPEPGGGITPTTGGTGLSVSLSTDKSEVKTGEPATFITTIKNLASEDAMNIVAKLNLTGWTVTNPIQTLSLLPSGGGYKFSWVLYAPKETSSFSSVVDVFYEMQTKKSIGVRIYDNDYLNTLSEDKRKEIGESSALQSETGSMNTPIAISVSLQQPFILTQDTQEFPFVITIQNIGSGETYNPSANYQSLDENLKNKVVFSYSGNYLTCDEPSGSTITLVDGSKGIACRFIVSKGDVANSLDTTANFTVNYAYLTRGTTTIKVV